MRIVAIFASNSALVMALPFAEGALLHSATSATTQIPGTFAPRRSRRESFNSRIFPLILRAQKAAASLQR